MGDTILPSNKTMSSAANTNAQANKTMGSPGVPVIPCACKSVCDCASSNSESKVPRSNSDSEWESESVSESDSNIHVNCASKKDLPVLPNLASFLFAFCLEKPKELFANVKNLEPGKHNKLNMDCYDQIIELYMKILTAKELNEQDFIHINNTIKYFGIKGLVTDELLIDIEKTFVENGYAFVISKEGDHHTPDALKYFNSEGNKFYAKENHELIGNMQSAQKVKELPNVIFDKIMEPIAKGDVLQSKINILRCLYFRRVMGGLGILKKEGYLSKVHLTKYTTLDTLIKGLLTERTKLCETMNGYPNKILDSLMIRPNGVIYYDVEYREYPMEDANRDLIGLRVCSPDHNTLIPLCEMCGVQNLWLDTFKKRGILIKEADSHNKRHIWHNDSKDK